MSYPYVPFRGALLLLYSVPSICLAQDATTTPYEIQAEALLPHQKAANQIDACLTLADERVAMLSEQLRELKTSRARLSTMEDALRKVTLQKSELEESLLLASKESEKASDLERQLEDASKTGTAYREETERLRKEIQRLSGQEAANKKQASELAAALKSLEVERKNLSDLSLAKNSSDKQVAAAQQQVKDLQARLLQTEETAKRLAPLQQERNTLTEQLNKLRIASASFSSSAEDSKLRLSQIQEEHAKASQSLTKVDGELKETLRKLAASEETNSRKQKELNDALAALEAEQAKALKAAELEKNLLALRETSENERQKLLKLQEIKQVDDTKLAQTEEALLISSDSLNKTEEELKDALNRLSAKTEEEIQRAKALEDALAALEIERRNAARAEELEKQLAALNQKYSKDSNALVKLEQARLSISNKFSEADQERIDSLRALTKAQDDLRDALSKLASRNESDLRQAKALQDAQAALRAEQAKAAKATELERQLADSKAKAAKASELERQLAEAEANAARAAELERQLADSKAKALDNQQALARFQSDADASKAKLAALTLAKKTADDRANELQGLKQQLSARDQEIQRLTAQLSKAQRELQNDSAAELEAKKLRDQLAAARQSRTVMEKDFLRIDPIQYALNSANIDVEEARVLSQAQKILRVYPQASFEISGHTCTLGSDTRNQTLSEQRAKRLLDFLAANGISPRQLASAGYGETKPLADNSTDAGRRQNRRVEIRVTSADGTTLLDTENR